MEESRSSSSSYSSAPSSSPFDPAIELHSETSQPPIFVTSNPNSDDLEALHLQQQELTTAKTRAGIVIQHRTWQTEDVLRSDEVFNPETPSKTNRQAGRDLSELERAKMTFSSSPVLYPPSSSPAIPRKKRKLFQTLKPEEPKRQKTVGGFLAEDGEDESDTSPDQAQENVSAKSAAVDLADVISENDLLSNPAESAFPDQNYPTTNYRSPSLPPVGRSLLRKLPPKTVALRTCSGKETKIPIRVKSMAFTFEETIAQRSATTAGRAKKAYYGIDIHRLIDEASTQKELDLAQRESEKHQQTIESVERSESSLSDGQRKTSSFTQMWTEKYRAKKFTDLIGDERTHRSVLRWLKGWDEVVFPGSVKARPKKSFEERDNFCERQHRKILLLTGPPGLGKTTLAHVCARQAGYEVLEINASDDRSRDVVKGRIKDALGTENVRGIKEHGKARRAGRPVCVIVDEVDGVVTGAGGGGGGEGGFMKALVDLVQLDQKNSHQPGQDSGSRAKGKKGDKFRFLRPLILICNDVYVPSLRPLRSSSIAEIVHVRKPPLDKVISRVKSVFEKENIPCDTDAVRRLCESSWGLGTRKQNSVGGRGAGEGDIRGVLVQGEWIAHKLRATQTGQARGRLTRKWIESHLGDTNASQGYKGLGRGGVREVVHRIFVEGAGLPNLPTSVSAEDSRLISESNTDPIGVADLRKRAAISALREMVDTCGDHDRLMTDCFARYPTQVYQDDVRLSKPNAGYEWLHFHDCLSSRIFSGQEWELNPYLNTSACGFHHLFSAVDKGDKSWNDDKTKEEAEDIDVHPFSGPKADFAAYEAEKQNRTMLIEFQSSFPAPLLRLFSSTNPIALELLPNVSKMLAPEVKPVVIAGNGGLASVASVRKDTEKTCVRNAVRIMGSLNISFEQVRVEIEGGGAHASAGFAFRMEPPLDALTSFILGKTTSGVGPAPVRYAVRQVLDQEVRKEKILRNSAARHARSTPLEHNEIDAYDDGDEDKENADASKARNQNENNKDKTKLPLPQTLAALPIGVKRDFFGRPIVNEATQPPSAGKGGAHIRSASSSAAGAARGAGTNPDAARVWISFNEGYSNAVRKPITLKELMESFF